jgi:hypothetical protein
MELVITEMGGKSREKYYHVICVTIDGVWIDE